MQRDLKKKKIGEDKERRGGFFLEGQRQPPGSSPFCTGTVFCQLLLTLLLNLVSGRTSSEVGHGHFSFSMSLLSFVVSLVLYPLGIGSERFESISRNVSERESRGLLNLTHLAYTLLPLFSLQLARLHGPGARSPTGAGT